MARRAQPPRPGGVHALRGGPGGDELLVLRGDRPSAPGHRRLHRVRRSCGGRRPARAGVGAARRGPPGPGGGRVHRGPGARPVARAGARRPGVDLGRGPRLGAVHRPGAAGRLHTLGCDQPGARVLLRGGALRARSGAGRVGGADGLPLVRRSGRCGTALNGRPLLAGGPGAHAPARGHFRALHGASARIERRGRRSHAPPGPRSCGARRAGPGVSGRVDRLGQAPLGAAGGATPAAGAGPQRSRSPRAAPRPFSASVPSWRRARRAPTARPRRCARRARPGRSPRTPATRRRSPRP